ncbi:MAG TPA: ABC transporter permease, partial [Bacteroidia bacterium]
EDRELLKRLSNEYGSWENVSDYYLRIKEKEKEIYSQKINSDNDSAIAKSKLLLHKLYDCNDSDKIIKCLGRLSHISFFSGYTGGYDSATKMMSGGVILERHSYKTIRTAFQKLISGKNSFKKYIPAIHWYGINNQYHHWLMNFLTGDFGISYQDKRPVRSSLFDAMRRTIGISLLSILLAYSIAIPLGIHSAIKKGTRNEKAITTILFALYSLPNFWIATMLVIFLCGGDYASWFPAPGSPPVPDDASFLYKFLDSMYRLILPLFCWTYASLTFISRQMRGGILSNITQDYIQTARAKGLEEKQVIWKHALKNSLLPMITLFASIFPLAISGSFVIETIFNIQGMGKLSLDALYARDYPVLFAVMIFTAFLTMLGHLVSDLLYAFIDPRISYTKNS